MKATIRLKDSVTNWIELDGVTAVRMEDDIYHIHTRNTWTFNGIAGSTISRIYRIAKADILYLLTESVEAPPAPEPGIEKIDPAWAAQVKRCSIASVWDEGNML